MSFTSPTTNLEIADIVARIDRAQAETRKFVAEQNKLTEEALKLLRDRWLAPGLAVVTAIGALGAFLAASITALRSLGYI